MLPDAPVGQRLDGPGEMRELAPEPVAFPDHGHFAFSEGAQTVLQPRPVVRRTGGVVPADLPRGDAGAAHDIALQIRGRAPGHGIACFGRTPHACLSLGPGAQVAKRLAQDFTLFRKQPHLLRRPDAGSRCPRTGAAAWTPFGEFLPDRRAVERHRPALCRVSGRPCLCVRSVAAVQPVPDFKPVLRCQPGARPRSEDRVPLAVQVRTEASCQGCAVACSRSGSFSPWPAPTAGAAATALGMCMTR